MISGVMFDFSGTLFRIESVEEWFLTLGSDGGLDGLDQAERTACVEQLTLAGAQPGGPQPQLAPAGWDQRDVDAPRHRAAYTAQTRAALLPTVGPDRADTLATALYERHMNPDAWQPYPDAEQVLKELRRRRAPVAVVSNIGWDLRPVFVRHGLDAYVDTYVLSFELQVQKPDPRIFRFACDQLGLTPAEVLMVGDDLRADGGARALGCAFRQVQPLPVAERPDQLIPALDLLMPRQR
ncbi:HAD superfamily hydrolase (TIGR01493 family) [Streptacidiphilus sp. MAP12-16]|uniref:HAD family hydrolase n=1 Tax=Streptacidiphilus sp. MAP12-16 TaxID=3156300 RepID=UPI003514164A